MVSTVGCTKPQRFASTVMLPLAALYTGPSPSYWWLSWTSGPFRGQHDLVSWAVVPGNTYSFPISDHGFSKHIRSGIRPRAAAASRRP
jgi:hypothetical protein